MTIKVYRVRGRIEVWTYSIDGVEAEGGLGVGYFRTTAEASEAAGRERKLRELRVEKR